MKKFIRKAAILLLIFVLGVAVSAILMNNNQTTDNRSDMNDAILPEVMVRIGDTSANIMYGYRQQMQADFSRDSITPLDTTKQLTFLIKPYEEKVSGLSYEIRTSDGNKVMENRKIKNLTKEDNGYLSTTIEISSDLRMNQEYSLQITLDTGDGEAYYYTRVVSRSQLNTESYLKFVNEFSAKCLDKMEADSLSGYLEEQDTTSGTNFNNVNINSGLSNISWGSLAPKLRLRGVPTINEINETTASITLKYQITADNDSGGTEVYDVTEFYRMRYTETRIMLLDFQRSATSIFDPTMSVVSDKGILLGVRDRDVTYTTSTEGSVIAFVQAGDLWSYSPGGGKINRIFSFRKESDGDSRDARNEHDIKIIRVDDNGDMDFVLYGYMNRGLHEGYSGVCVYHYNSDRNVVEEKAFIPSTESYQFLKKDLGTLTYVNSNNQLFLLFAQKLYQVDVESGESQVLEEGIRQNYFKVSDSNAHAAWLVVTGDEKGRIREVDFDTAEIRILKPSKGQRLRVLGFLNEDLVYGLLSNEDILTDDNGHSTEGISTVRIESFEGELKKEYHQDGLYITKATVGSTLAEFELSAKSGNTYTVQKKDNIMNNKVASASQTEIELTSTSRTGTMVRLALQTKPATDKPLVISAKIQSTDNDAVLLDTKVPQGEVYYVYASGMLDMTYTDPAAAIRRANAKTGVVLNRAQQYVWERGNKKTQIQLNTDDIPDIFKSASWKKSELQDGLGEDGTVIDLTGCSLESVLYEISAQRPVIAKTGADTSVVIVGYDEYNTYLYDPSTGQTSPYGMNDSTALFKSAGNVFLTYIENVTE